MEKNADFLIEVDQLCWSISSSACLVLHKLHTVFVLSCIK